jgi:hypothetical protein
VLAGDLPSEARAVVVWEGRPRGENDATQGFAELARRHGLDLDEVLTASA